MLRLLLVSLLVHSSIALQQYVTGESALLDKETGRILWESHGSTTLQGSTLSIPRNELPCIVLSSILWMQVYRWVVTASLAQPAWFSRLLQAPRAVLPYLPECSPLVLVVVIFLYLLESFATETRRYLTHRVTSDYVQALREAPPVVSWIFRSLEKPEEEINLLSSISKSSKRKALATDSQQDLSKSPEDASVPFVPSTTPKPTTWWKQQPRRQQVIRTQDFAYKHFSDATTAGIWQRRQGSAWIQLQLGQLFVLGDAATRDEYFGQQRAFVARQGTEGTFSTAISCVGFQSRVLLGPVGRFSLRNYWIFTLLGLTLPYRIWFYNACDHLRLNVVKEMHQKKMRRKDGESDTLFELINKQETLGDTTVAK